MHNVEMQTEPSSSNLRNRVAEQLRCWNGLGAIVFLGVAASVVWVATPVAAAIVLVWVWGSRTPLKSVGLVRPKSWIGGLVIGVVIGLSEKLLMKALVLPLLGAPAVNSAYHFLAGNPKRAVIFGLLSIFEAGICEEIIFRGFLFERFGRLLGDSSAARLAIVLISSVMFGMVHFNQGLAGIENATIGGVFAGVLYLLNQRRLYLVMVAHAAFDLGSLVLIYWNLESYVAHLFL